MAAASPPKVAGLTVNTEPPAEAGEVTLKVSGCESKDRSPRGRAKEVANPCVTAAAVKLPVAQPTPETGGHIGQTTLHFNPVGKPPPRPLMRPVPGRVRSPATSVRLTTRSVR